MPPKKTVPAAAQQTLPAAAPRPTTTAAPSTGRKPWVKKTPVDVVLMCASAKLGHSAPRERCSAAE